MSDFLGTATDPFSVADTDTLSLGAASGSGLRTMRVSPYENRVNWGNSVDDSPQGPDFSVVDEFLQQKPAGPVTLGQTYRLMRACKLVGMRLFKHPAVAGTFPIRVWKHSDGSVLVQQDVTWVADDGGWRTIMYDIPVDGVEGESYDFGYFYAGGGGEVAPFKYPATMWVWNGGLPMVVDPFFQEAFISGASGKTGGSWSKTGGAITFSSAAADREPTDYYIDPIADITLDTPGYDGGTEYWNQFLNGAPSHPVPFGIDFADPQYLVAYAALGLNTLFAGSASDDYIAAVKASGLDWYPTLHDNDMGAPIVVQEDTALAPLVKGYQLTDEPEFHASVYSPAVLKTWRNNCRHIDSTRPVWLNLGRLVVQNQDFVWTPSGISAENVNKQWRDYMLNADIGSIDAYSLAGTSSFDGRAAGAYNRYGIWAYPMQIGRMRQLTDERMPLWSSVETTSEIPGLPLPSEVVKAVWATFIGGARGCMLFDHRFADGDVTQNFAAMLADAPMSAAVAALAAQVSALGPAIAAREEHLIESYASSTNLASTQGGYAAGTKVPIHFATRYVAGSSYLFVQSIRHGTTTGTFFCPSLKNATLTVIGEGRTVNIDAAGFFSDTFTEDYAYHLYSTTADPAYASPVNTVAASIVTDGTPTTGEQIRVSEGTWTGIPAPVFTYQWKRAGVNIAGATHRGYVLQVADEGVALTCAVTATNRQGASTSTTASITSSAGGGGGGGGTAYQDAVLADSPIAYWRLADLTDEVGSRDLSVGSGLSAPGAGPAMDSDAGSASKRFTSDSGQGLAVADDAALRLDTAFTLDAIVLTDENAATFNAVQKNQEYRLGQFANGKPVAHLWTSGGNFWDAIGSAVNTEGVPYHLAMTFDGTTLKLYVNGTLDATVGSITGSPETANSPVQIGKGVAAGWFGNISNVAIYPTVLSAGRIAAHAAAM